MSKTFAIMRKELWSYFSSPTAAIFLGTYLCVSLFTFFWVEKFFARNIADLRPLFEWMPVLLIFLISTLTMKMWSEERRMGTVEFLLTLPVKTSDLVLGKFLACMALVGTALLLTFGLTFSVGILGNLDWGPVLTAYLASMLLAGAYTSIGLYVSSKTDSQIISLIITASICGVFYVVGSTGFVSLFGNNTAEILRALGTGSRFESISRGVLDLRDIYYYASICVTFLALNGFSLERLKWSMGSNKENHRMITTFVTVLLLNVIAANFWLGYLHSARLDVTKNKIYSLSDASLNMIENLQEPLLIRGYFSAETHPLLAPLVPAIKDILMEFQIKSHGKVRSEVVDPRAFPELEAELSRKFNIEPTPFQISGRNSTAMVNSYFNILISYGNQNEVLGFQDLIELHHDNGGNIEVKLKNPEYDILKSVRKVVQAFNHKDNMFSQLGDNVKFMFYVSEDTLPEQLKAFTGEVKKAVAEYEAKSKGKLKVEFLDPSKDEALAQKIAQDYGFKPQAMGLFANQTFYFYPSILDNDKLYSLGIPENLNLEGFKTSFEATLKRMVPGYLRTVGLHVPPAGGNPMMAQYGMPPSGKQFQALQKKLEENYNTVPVDLENGLVPSNVDIMVVVAPKDLSEKQVFALDQFLMQGGTVALMTSPLAVNKQRGGFDSEKYNSGLSDWLTHNGVKIPEEFVLDKRNSGFPLIRTRMVEGLRIKEPSIQPYPFFVDVRGKNLNDTNGITSSMAQILVPWASPIELDKELNKDRKITSLITSSKDSWKTSNTSIEADFETYPGVGFPQADKLESSVLAAMVEGRFESYFKGKENPRLKKDAPTKSPEDNEESKATSPEDKASDSVVDTVLEKSSDSARLIVFASNEMVADDTIQIASMVSGSQYLNTLQILENSVDWSIEDRTLLAIRSRSHFARTLQPMSDTAKRNWELVNYFMALAGLLLVYGGYRILHRRSLKHYKNLKLA